jgi:hypothetical protein
MASFYVTQKPEWEVTEQGWHAVVTPSNSARQWTAYVESSDTALWRIWAGCLFGSVQDAQEWCRHEIAHQQTRSLNSLEHDHSMVWGNVEAMYNSDFMAY